MVRIATHIGVLAMALALGPTTLAQRPGPAPPARQTLTVTGQGEVEAPPDRAVVRMGAVVQAPQAAAAQKAVSQVMLQALDKVQAAGITKEAVRTVDLSLTPVYQHSKPEQEAAEPRIVGYRASNSIEVKIDDLQRIGQVIDAAVAAGANQVQSIDFQLRDDTAAQRKALARAAENARIKAESLAGAMGAQLGPVISAVESGSILPQPRFRMGRAALAEASAETPIQPGELQIRATATIQYRLIPKE